MRWHIPDERPLVSIVIPTKDRVDLLGPCVSSILQRTHYERLEIIVVDHDSHEAATASYLELLARDPRVRIESYKGEFNWSALNNLGASKARGEILCFLNNDVVIFDGDWLTELVGNALRPDVGAVGAKLLYEDGTIQHAGVVLGVAGHAGHAFQRLTATNGGYLGRAICAQRVSAVTGACLVCRKTVFQELGGFDAATFPVALNDVDFCLRAAQRGYGIVWTPHAILYHFESMTRGYDDVSPAKKQRLSAEAAALRARWGSILERDPHYNPHFDLNSPPYERLVLPNAAWAEEFETTAEGSEEQHPSRVNPSDTVYHST